ncbi:MAG TPA: hypothetical protein VGM88_18850 [Kofleriaceae bacterium]|jgi:hypothetical protein
MNRIVVAALIVAVVGSRSWAGVVVAVRVGEGSNAETVLAPLLEEMETVDPLVISRPATMRPLVNARPARSGLPARGLTALDLLEDITTGQKLWRSGQVAEAIETLVPVIEKAHENPTAIVNDEAHRDSMLTALVALAMAYQNRAEDQRLSKHAREEMRSKSEDVMAELVRSFPNGQAAVLDGFGSDATKQYRAASERLAAQGHGTLVVRVDDPNALIFVNEWDHPSNATFEANVLPGVYRILVRTPGSDGLRYDVEVAPNQHAQLDVDSGFDGAITLGDRFVGLTFATEANAQQSAVSYARRLAGIVDPNSRALWIVRAAMWEGKPAVIGVLYDRETGLRVRGKGVVLDGHDDNAKVRRLGRALLRPYVVERDNSGVFVVPDPASEGERARVGGAPPQAPVPSKAPEIAFGTGSLVALGVGGAGLYLNEAGFCAGRAVCSKVLIGSSLALGGVLAVGAIYFHVRRNHFAHGAVTAVVPMRSGVLFSSEWSF